MKTKNKLNVLSSAVLFSLMSLSSIATAAEWKVEDTLPNNQKGLSLAATMVREEAKTSVSKQTSSTKDTLSLAQTMVRKDGWLPMGEVVSDMQKIEKEAKNYVSKQTSATDWNVKDIEKVDVKKQVEKVFADDKSNLVGAVSPTGEGGTILHNRTGEVVKNRAEECWFTERKDTSVFKGGNHAELIDCDVIKPIEKQIEKVMEVPVVSEPKFIEETISLKAKTLFGFGTSELTDTVQLNKIVDKVKESRYLDEVLVEGHTDFMGKEDFNQKLSEKRAMNVAAFLKSHLGLNENSSKIKSVGLGESQAKMTEQCQAEVAKLGKKVSAAKKRAHLISCIEPDRRVDIKIRTHNIKRVDGL